MPSPTPSPERLVELIARDLGVREPIDAATPLLSSGIVDSFHVTALLALLEARYGVPIDPADVGVDNFDTVEQIHRFLGRAP